MIVSRTLKVTVSHVMYDSSVWFLRAIMSSSSALFRWLICIVASIFFFVQCIIKKIIRFGFWDIRNNQGLGKGYQRCKCCFTMKVFQFYVHSNNEFGTMVTLGSQLVQYGFQVLLQLKTLLTGYNRKVWKVWRVTVFQNYILVVEVRLCVEIFSACVFILYDCIGKLTHLVKSSIFFVVSSRWW